MSKSTTFEYSNAVSIALVAVVRFYFMSKIPNKRTRTTLVQWIYTINSKKKRTKGQTNKRTNKRTDKQKIKQINEQTNE